MRHKRQATELQAIAELRGLQRLASETVAATARQQREARANDHSQADEALIAAGSGWAAQIAAPIIDPSLSAAWAQLVDQRRRTFVEMESLLDVARREEQAATQEWQIASARDEAARVLARRARKVAARRAEERALAAIEDRSAVRSLMS